MKGDEAQARWCRCPLHSLPKVRAPCWPPVPTSIPLDLYPGAGAWGPSPGTEQIRGLSSSGKVHLCLMLRDPGVGQQMTLRGSSPCAAAVPWHPAAPPADTAQVSMGIS